MEFEIIVWFSLEDYAFIAEVPGHPTFLAQGQTEDEAVSKLKEVLNARLEMQQPKDI